MKYLIAVVVIIGLVLIPNLVYAWPEPKYVKAGFLKWGDTGVQWRDEARTSLIVSKNPVPQNLDIIQASRWRMASPSARPRLAQLYGVPKEVAIICGAFYLETESNTQYGYPAGFKMGNISP